MRCCPRSESLTFTCVICRASGPSTRRRSAHSANGNATILTLPFYGSQRAWTHPNGSGIPLLSIERLIESLGLSASELKRYLVAEIDESLATDGSAGPGGGIPRRPVRPHGDGLGPRWPAPSVGPRSDRREIRQRLRTHAAVTRHPREYHDDRIPELPVGVVHFASSAFGAQWQPFDALRSGTVAEIAMLTDAPFSRRDRLTNHCIVTFADTAALEYDILGASGSMDGGNTIRCRVPDFMFVEAKRTLRFSEFADYLALQVLAALDGLRIAPQAVAHLHSWENGFLMESSEFVDFLRHHRTIFSPYLTVARLRSLVKDVGGDNWTMTSQELAIGSEYEKTAGQACERVVLESESDRAFYADFLPHARLDVRSFVREQSSSFSSTPPETGRLTFLAGGRPVREKGFAELCREFAGIRDWATERDLKLFVGDPVQGATTREGCRLHLHARGDRRGERVGRCRLDRAQAVPRAAASENRRCLGNHRSLHL